MADTLVPTNPQQAQKNLQALARKLDRYYRSGGRTQNRDVPRASEINKLFQTSGALEISEISDVLRTGISHWYEAHQSGLLAAKTEILKALSDEPPPPGTSVGFWGNILGNGIWAIGGGMSVGSGIAVGAMMVNPFGIAAGLLGVAIAIGTSEYSSQYSSKQAALQKAEQNQRWTDFGSTLNSMLDGLLAKKTLLERRISDVKPTIFRMYIQLVAMGKVGPGKQMSHAGFKDMLQHGFTRNRDKSSLRPSYVQSKIVALWKEYNKMCKLKYRSIWWERKGGSSNYHHGDERRLLNHAEALRTAASRINLPESLSGRTGNPMQKFQSKAARTVQVWIERVDYGKNAPDDSWSKADLEVRAWFNGEQKTKTVYTDAGKSFTLWGQSSGWKTTIDPDVNAAPVFAISMADSDLTRWDPAGLAKMNVPIGTMRKNRVYKFKVRGRKIHLNSAYGVMYTVHLAAKVS